MKHCNMYTTCTSPLEIGSMVNGMNSTRRLYGASTTPNPSIVVVDSQPQTSSSSSISSVFTSPLVQKIVLIAVCILVVVLVIGGASSYCAKQRGKSGEGAACKTVNAVGDVASKLGDSFQTWWLYVAGALFLFGGSLLKGVAKIGEKIKDAFTGDKDTPDNSKDDPASGGGSDDNHEGNGNNNDNGDGDGGNGGDDPNSNDNGNGGEGGEGGHGE